MGENVDPAKAHIKKALRQRLGTKRAEPYWIAPLKQIPGTRYRRFGLKLPPEAIQIASRRDAATLPDRHGEGVQGTVASDEQAP